MGEDLDINIGPFIPAVALSAETALALAGAVEQQKQAIGAILLYAAQGSVRSVIEPFEGFVTLAGNGAALAPYAKTVTGPAFDRQGQVLEIDLPDAQGRAEIIVKLGAGPGCLRDLDMRIARFITSGRQQRRGHGRHIR